MTQLNLLVVDDEGVGARLLKANLDRPGRVRCEIATSGSEALSCLERSPFHAVITDLAMPGMDGIELVRRIRETDPTLPVFIMTAHATLDRAVDGIRAGATDFLPKPLNVTAVLALIERAVADRPLREEVSDLRRRRTGLQTEQVILGHAPALERVREMVRQIARATDSRVLITGESGTGKSMLARCIHDLSGVTGRFVEVNCAALPSQLLESELFGHEKGAFTDAKTMKRGLIEAAEGGTILLDEIGSLSLELQAKLLLFLDRREIRRVGGLHPIPVQTRVIAATNEDLTARVVERSFRQDLYYRINVASVEMPPLREMPEVIPTLAEHFTQLICGELRKPVPPMTEASFAALVRYPWPGNARELRNALERALIFHFDGPFVVGAPATSPTDGRVSGAAVEGLVLGPRLPLEEVERRYIRYALTEDGVDLNTVAAHLGISRKTLWEKRRRFGL